MKPATNGSPVQSDALAAFEAAQRGAYRFAERPQSAAAAAPAATSVAQPPKAGRRGRWLIAALMLAACGSGLLTVWDSLLRYQAYGVVTGRIVDVSVPLDGVLKSVHVREGDIVRQNDRLATVHDLEFEQKLARVADELRIADATLHAEIARIQWQSHVEETEMTRAIAEFFEGSSRLHDASGALDLARNELTRTQELSNRSAVADVELVNQTILEETQQRRLDAIRDSLEVLRQRAEAAQQVPRLGSEQLTPLTAKCEMLLNEIQRLRDWLQQGELRAPCNGTVLTRYQPAGECVKSHEPLFSVLEESSTEIELYVPQQLTADFQVGQTLQLKIDPLEELVPCVITAIGSEHRKPPEHIEIYYRSNIRLLPVRLRPVGPALKNQPLPVGAVCKLPHSLLRS